MSICQTCREAAEISSKNLSELNEAFENAKLLGISSFDGTFEDYIIQAHRRSEQLHQRCQGETHCFCQHRNGTSELIRDLT